MLNSRAIAQYYELSIPIGHIIGHSPSYMIDCCVCTDTEHFREQRHRVDKEKKRKKKENDSNDTDL